MRRAVLTRNTAETKIAITLPPSPAALAGGVRSPSEVEALHEIGVDAVVGMALYTGTFEIPGRS